MSATSGPVKLRNNMSRMFVLGSMFMCFALSGRAGEFNEVLSIGSPAPTWKHLPGVDGKAHDFDEWKGKPYLVVVFTCNSCPCARDYEDRIKAFVTKHQDKVAVVAINANTIA